MGFFEKIFGTYSDKELKRISPMVDKVMSLEDEFSKMSDQQLKDMTPKLKARLENGETLEDILPEAFATCREAAWRVLGMKHFKVQVIGGIVLHQGRIAEMRTGEGKTLVGTLPSYLNALTGKGVHVVTVNDYLAKRDSEWMGKVHRFLGLTVGLAISGMSPIQKKQAYACDITYGTNNEFGFDYLRDNMVVKKENCVQRGFNFAIVDEVDSILVDEARTPLIISGRGEESSPLYMKADKFAKGLTQIKVVEVNEKESQDDITADYIVDEKAKTSTLTPIGAKKAERYFGVDNINDPDNVTILHHINQAIRANGYMVRDIDYIVKDGEVLIIDENTGRQMVGRRYNDGLHQAIEAKEGVKIAAESKTLATVTYQNYFRLYSKLSGMTGTALTEEDEFRQIYNLDVIVIPTNKPILRIDNDDVVYKTLNGKYKAVVAEVLEKHKKGQPVLVGTVTIENSETLSKLLSKAGIPHEVLNAKNHLREAHIVAQAGKKGAVTIATNMAGRGTDIMLGGNPDFMARDQMAKLGYDEKGIDDSTSYFETNDETILNARKVYNELLEKYKDEIKDEAREVKENGGLVIIGTERHESRRIDNQLRGRAGRQGDPGETRFYLSAEDDLMRLFGGDNLASIMDRFKVDEDTPMEAKMLSNTIRSAQARVEGRNFSIRKSVLQFDDIMNIQREVIYTQRQDVINGKDIGEFINIMFSQVVEDIVGRYILDDNVKDDWNLVGLRSYLNGWLCTPNEFKYTNEELEDVTKQDIIDKLTKRAKNVYRQKVRLIGEAAAAEIERVVLLHYVDTHWISHIDDMNELKKGIYLRSYAQKNIILEYRVEGSEMFDNMISTIREDTVKHLIMFKVVQKGANPNAPQRAPQRAVNPAAKPMLTQKPSEGAESANSEASSEALNEEEVNKFEAADNFDPNSAPLPAEPTAEIEKPLEVKQVAVPTEQPAKTQTLSSSDKVGRNDPCPCGSGQKYKKCCGK